MEKSKLKIIKTAGVAAAGFVSLVILYFAVVYFAFFKTTFGRNDKERSAEHEIEFYAGEENYKTHLADVEWFNGKNCPLIEMTSFDGLKLKAYVLEPEKACAGTVILMHGYHSGPVREFASICKIFYSMNYRVILPFQRAHGISEGKWVTFGIKERYDCYDWICKINEDYGQELPLFAGGISMGCATVTMASGFKLPENLKGFIADCGFTSPWEICYWTMTKLRGVPAGVANLLLKSCNWICKKTADFSLDGWSTQRALNGCNKPFLFITGTKDNMVPWEMTMTNFLHYKMKNPDNTKLVLFEDGPHAVSYLIDSQLYENELRSFVKKYEK